MHKNIFNIPMPIPILKKLANHTSIMPLAPASPAVSPEGYNILLCMSNTAHDGNTVLPTM